jgi:hypothetical protein
MTVEYREPEEHEMEQVYVTDGERVVTTAEPVVAAGWSDTQTGVVGEWAGGRS